MSNTSKRLTLVGTEVQASAAARASGEAVSADDRAGTGALLKTASLQGALFNSMRFSGIVTDADGLIQSFSPGAQRLLGYTAAEMAGQRPMTALHDPQDLHALAGELSLKFSTPIGPDIEALVFPAVQGLADVYELDLLCKDGSRIPALVTVLPLFDDAETILGYLMIPTENRARAQAREAALARHALLESESFKRAILNSLEAEIAVVDGAGVIREVNETWRRFAIDNGIEPSRPAPHTGIGTNYLAFCDTGDGSVSPAYQGIQAVLSGAAPSFNMEYPCHSPTEQRWFTMCVLPLGQPATKGAVIAHTDISAYKRMGQVLEDRNIELENARQVAEKANLAKSDFLSSMSHELRTPLGSILGFAQLLESGSPAPTPIQRRSVDQILQAGWYQLELINEILDLALVESGKLSLSPEAVPLAEVMRECEAMVELQAQKRGVQVSFPQLEQFYVVNADRVRLKQVLINLLSNAIKYNREGGRVIVDCAATSPGRVRISIEDTGEGLGPEKLAQLFQSFNRLGQESGSEEGTGIGLVMSKRLVELMGGVIGARSTVGQGSVFWIEMALTAGANASAAGGVHTVVPQLPLQIEAPRRTLLCVEDSLPNLMLVESLMERRPDVRLITARDGLAGLKLARESLPDVILMDINLPGISGLKAMSLLAEDPATAHIPVIAISATAMPHDIQRGLEAGFFRYLTKPIRLGELMATLDDALKISPQRAG
jgi:signal transduction histidine kinase/CheY-like chemotaxis protein